MAPELGETKADGPLPDEERQAFGALELEGGDWRALYPVPFLLAVRNDGRLEEHEAPLAWDAIGLVTAPGAPAAGLSPKAVQFLQGLLYDGRNRPEEAERLRIARELLCWHLAKGLSPQECSGWFDHIENLGGTIFSAAEDRRAFARVMAELRESVDDCLPRRRYAQADVAPSLREPGVELDWLDVRSWQPLAVVPLAELVLQSHEEQATRLCQQVVEALQARERSPGPLADLLAEGNWELAFRTLTTMDHEASRGRIADARRLLAQGLATLRLRQRETILAELTAIAEEARWVKPSRWSRASAAYGSEAINRVFDALRDEVAQVRRAVAAPPSTGGELPVSPPGLPSAAPADPSIPEGAGLIAEVPEPVQRPAVPRFDPIELLEIERSRTIGWQECLQEASAFRIDGPHSSLEEQILSIPLLFEEFRSGGVVVVPEEQLASLPKSLWFVGDLHCDLVALVNAWRYIEETSLAEGVKPSVIFLGDFVDRGLYGCETLRYLFRLVCENPGQIAVVPGNHDEFSWDETAGSFVSPVTPAETIGQLNAAVGKHDTESRDCVRLGRLAANFFAGRPKAIFLPDGLLLSHGGFPHADLLPQLQTLADLSRPEALSDFVWLRCSTARRRRPNRASRGCEFGQENFAEFRTAAEGLGLSVRQIVRGHDHIPARYRTSDGWDYPATTINTMCRPLAGEFGVERYPLPCVARHVPHQLPQIHRMRLDTAVVDQAYGAERPAFTADETESPASGDPS